MKLGILGGVAMVSMTALLAGPAFSFEGKSVAASDCNYGGKIKSIVATDEHTVTFSMCSPDPAFEAKAAFVSFGIEPSEHIEKDGPKKALLDNPQSAQVRIQVVERGSLSLRNAGAASKSALAGCYKY